MSLTFLFKLFLISAYAFQEMPPPIQYQISCFFFFIYLFSINLLSSSIQISLADFGGS